MIRTHTFGLLSHMNHHRHHNFIVNGTIFYMHHQCKRSNVCTVTPITRSNQTVSLLTSCKDRWRSPFIGQQKLHVGACSSPPIYIIRLESESIFFVMKVWALKAFPWYSCHGNNMSPVKKMRENRMQVEGGFSSMFHRTGTKRCVSVEANIHNACRVWAGSAFFSIIHLNYYDTVCMCTSQTPTRKISLKWKLIQLCVNLLQHKPKNFLQRCQSAAPPLALTTADRGNYSVSFDDCAV